ncbi:type IVB secretion system protein IcmH/DotU [Erwinia persicina]|uniref:type IVB secretion system protein IcmH/DotU n=1 Tax=Erwinia persicina TaxID=55211 RepID=UPI00177CC43A|nr:type IVB secretion system protein IcmH/DotU [Erwinia persicina]MBD8161847.1 DotU family type IV/VI secretion system protein [Erwinia persicina]MBD8212710.1 DotU family type IV/VI secretion system protein [Erwinia persicina]
MTSEFPVDPATPVNQDNALLVAASPLLNAIVQIRLAATHDDPAGLRLQLIDEMRQFEARCKQAGMPFEMIIGARYCLCAVLDEAAAQTPWGSRGVWSGNGLLVTFHNESWGGEKVFQLLSRISQNPGQHLWLLEVIHFCLLLGYEGRYRSMDNGRLQRDGVRSRLAQLIREVRGEQQQQRPQTAVAAGQSSLWRPPVPLWVCVTLATFIGCMIFSTLNWRLGNAAEPLLRQIWQTPLPKVVAGQRSTAPQALLDLRQRLSDLITERKLDVADSSNGSKVILPADRLFDPATTVLSPEGRALIARVATAMESAKGTILVSVFTDDERVLSRRFPSNYEYAAAQARAVSTMMAQLMSQPGISVRAQGRGDSGALLPNDSMENRAQNRRVEITLFAAPESDDSHSTGKK